MRILSKSEVNVLSEIDDTPNDNTKKETSEEEKTTGNHVSITWSSEISPGKKNSMATTGGTLGIIGFVLGWIPIMGIWFGFILGVLGIIFSGIGLSRSSKLEGSGKTFAILGLILSIIIVVLKLIPGINLL